MTLIYSHEIVMPKYRGKRLSDGQWIESSGINLVMGQYKMFDYDANAWVDIDAYTLGMYTGKDDKKGRKIFHGDLVMAKTPYSTDRPKEIVWDTDRAGFYMGADFVSYDSKNLYKLSSYKMEIVGNKWDNPDIFDKVYSKK